MAGFIPMQSKQYARYLSIFLYIEGSLAMVGFIATVFPWEWIVSLQALLDCGPMPDGPTARFLTRSLAMFYGLLGLLLWVFAGDIERYAPAIATMSKATMVWGVVLVGVDSTSGMPLWWIYANGPIVSALGGISLWLLFKVGSITKR